MKNIRPRRGTAITTLSVLVRSAAALAAAALLASSGTTLAQAQQPIVINEAYPSMVATFWPNYAAAHEGFYAKQGLNVQDVVVDPNISVATLIGGSVDITYGDSTQLMLALQKGANLTAVGLGAERNPYHFMTPGSIKTFADLKGKKVGIASAIDVYTYVLKVIFQKHGLNPDTDIEWVAGGGQNQRLAAIQGGAIQGGLFTPPSDSRLTDAGFNTLAFTPDYFPDLTLSVQTVRTDWAQQHADILRKMLLAQNQALQWLNNPANKAAAIQLLVDVTHAQQQDAAASYDYYIGKHVWKDACVHPAGLLNVVKIMTITKQLTTFTEADASKHIDTQYCAKR